MNRIFIDMDGVIVDFDNYAKTNKLSGEQVKAIKGAYLEMLPIPGALEAVRSLIGMGYDVWLATKPPTGIAHAYSDKAAWVFQHLPELKRKFILTHDKGLLGDRHDYLIDDRPHKANCREFAGRLLAVDFKGAAITDLNATIDRSNMDPQAEFFSWEAVLNFFRITPMWR